MRLADVTLDDRYNIDKKTVLLSGTQAVLRAMLMQRARDAQAGHNTAAYVSGYRGSPLGGLDQQFTRAKPLLERNKIVFQPGLNEDLAATASWGAQQAELRGEGLFDGVFCVWYGKGPGVDRSGDVFRHANLAGTSRLGGVLALMGDDHVCESSTTAHQSEFALVDAMMPILNPAGVQEVLDFAALGWALSRFSGCWVGLKCIKDTIESTAIVDGSIERVKITKPGGFDMPENGLNIRVSDPALAQEERLHRHKLRAARAFARANAIDKCVITGGKQPKIGIVTMGKSFLDTIQALDELGIDELAAAKLGVALYKVGMVWPLEPEGVIRFARGLDVIIVVEEKRGLVEDQLKQILYAQKGHPAIIGKRDENGEILFPSNGALDPNHIAIEIGKRLVKSKHNRKIAQRLNALEDVRADVQALTSPAQRTPYFCAGCPHNSSTIIPEGARAYAGIGCHWMVQLLDRNTEGFTHMGGEGANWIGEAPFSTRAHVFQNLGDGTYNHSGSLAIRAAMAAKTNITFKILFNDAVAMTGGQPHEGGLSVGAIAAQVLAEGVSQLAVVSDEPEKYTSGELPKDAKVYHRKDLNLIQSELAKVPGVSILIYDQTCAAEKRRRRKRGTFSDPDKRVFINELVCEGCGDCAVQSNCLAIVPAQTPFGRKRQIDQSTCNKDFSCLNGFCPSFVTVHGGVLRSPAFERSRDDNNPDRLLERLPDPKPLDLAQPFGVVIAGVGGTGVVTISALLGMAAHLEGKACGIVDMAGLAQKGGAVLSHVKIANLAKDIRAVRVGAGRANLILGCDLVVTGTPGVMALMKSGLTRVVADEHETMPGEFTRNRDYQLPGRKLVANIKQRVLRDDCSFIDASTLCARLVGDTISTNLLLLGFAYQHGYLPLGASAIERAIELNGVSVEMNIAAFRWGRALVFDRAGTLRAAGENSDNGLVKTAPKDLDQLIEFYHDELCDYQNQAYGARYRALVAKVRAAEADLNIEGLRLSRAVAETYFKLLAYKDEYEVARLYSDGRFAASLAAAFSSAPKLEFHLAPPVLAGKDAFTGKVMKRHFGAWMMVVFKLLAQLKFVRGTPFDLFGYSGDRKLDMELIRNYEAVIDKVLIQLMSGNHVHGVELALLPQSIKGFGHVKAAAVKNVTSRQVELFNHFDDVIPATRVDA